VNGYRIEDQTDDSSNDIAVCNRPIPKKSNAPKEKTMTNENPILEEGVILNEMGIEEVEEVLAPAIYLTA